MAYLNHLYSVPSDCLERCTRWKVIHTFSTKMVACSHLIGYWSEFEPLRNVLGQALDGGVVLDAGWRHQLRVPTVHTSEKVSDLAKQLEVAWAQTEEEYGEFRSDDWWRIEIEKYLSLFRHAANRGEAVISILEQSMFIDEEEKSTSSEPRPSFLERWLPWLANR